MWMVLMDSYLSSSIVANIYDYHLDALGAMEAVRRGSSSQGQAFICLVNQMICKAKKATFESLHHSKFKFGWTRAGNDMTGESPTVNEDMTS
jgi:hypothetical protein